jgi:hypothetical protein
MSFQRVVSQRDLGLTRFRNDTRFLALPYLHRQQPRGTQNNCCSTRAVPAGQAALAGQPRDTVTIATTNLARLNRFPGRPDLGSGPVGILHANEAGPCVELPKSDASLGTEIHSERLETLRFLSGTTPPALSILVASVFPSRPCFRPQVASLFP